MDRQPRHSIGATAGIPKQQRFHPRALSPATCLLKGSGRGHWGERPFGSGGNFWSEAALLEFHPQPDTRMAAREGSEVFDERRVIARFFVEEVFQPEKEIQGDMPNVFALPETAPKQRVSRGGRLIRRGLTLPEDPQQVGRGEKTVMLPEDLGTEP